MTRAVESKSSPENRKTASGSLKSGSSSPRLQLVDGPIAPDARIGDRLRATRLSKGLEIDEIARQLRLRRDYIEAMEMMQVARLPKGFVNPYIRDYARHLGMDPNATVNAFNEQCGALAQAMPEPVNMPKASSNNLAVIKIGALIVGVAAALALGWFGFKYVSTPTSEPITDTSPAIAVDAGFEQGSRAPVTADPAAQLGNGMINLDVVANRRAWINIRGADGTEFIDRQLAPGKVYDVRVGAGWTLSTQDAGAFSWAVDGVQIAPIGEDGQALYTVSIDTKAAEIRDLMAVQAQERADAQ